MAKQGFCHGPLWDQDLVWNTDDPELTPCFQQTLLSWLPTLVLLVLLPLDIRKGKRSLRDNLPWSALNTSKLVVTAGLVIEAIIEAAIVGERHERSVASVLAPVVRMVGFLVSILLLCFQKRYGLHSSGPQFFFFLVNIGCTSIKLRTKVKKHSMPYPIADLSIPPPTLQRNSTLDVISIDSQYQNQDEIHVELILLSFELSLSCLLFFLNCWSDAGPGDEDEQKQANPCPQLKASFFSNLFHFWYFPIIWTGFRRSLTTKDMWDLQPWHSAKRILPSFKKTLKSNEEDIKEKIKNTGRDVKVSLVPVIWKEFWPEFLFGCCLHMGGVILNIATPQILKLMISFAESFAQSDPEKQQEAWKGYFYAILLTLATTSKTLLEHHFAYSYMYIIGMKVKTSIISTIYQKSLRISAASKRTSSIGETVNLMAVDRQKVMEAFRVINWAWSQPLQIILSVVFIYRELGLATLAGFSMLIIMQLASAVVLKYIRGFHELQMKFKDKRVKLVNEILNGMKILKLFAWEPSYIEQVMNVRSAEISVLKKSKYFGALTQCFTTTTPFLFLVTSFGAFVFMDGGQELTPAKALVTVSYLKLLKIAMEFLPIILMMLVQAHVSMQRLNKFINNEELDLDSVSHDDATEEAVTIENGNFTWSREDDLVLKNINLQVKKGSLTAIVGTVGSGKSSLLSAMLGELHKDSGHVNTQGKIAYVSQQAWIQNATLKENILFGGESCRDKYNAVVAACALKSDFKVLPAGDETEIGEKGINLSGGQKQRVSLARSVYNNADLYLLDDPLSAVDSHVGKHIFNHIVGPEGMLGDATRILVTHGITYLPHVDNIVVMQNGCITEQGSYKELVERKGAFADFLLEYMIEEEEEGEEDTDVLQMKNLLEEAMGEEFVHRKRLKSICSGGSTISSKSGKKIKEGMKLTQLATPEVKAGTKLIEKEKAETGSVTWGIYYHYFKALGFVMAISAVVFQFICVTAENMTNYWILWWTENRFGNSSEPAYRDMYLGVYAGIGIISALSSALKNVIIAYATLRASGSLHKQMLESVIASPMSFFDTTPHGRIINRFSKDVDVCDNTLPMAFGNLLGLLFSFLAIIVIILQMLGGYFLFVVVPLMIIFIALQKMFISAARQINRLESISKSPIYSHFSESIAGAPTIRAFGLQKEFIYQSEQHVEANQSCYFSLNMSKLWLALNLEMLVNLITVGVALFVAFQRDVISPSQVGLVITYAQLISWNLTYMVRMVSELETNMVAVERMKEYSCLTQEKPWIIPDHRPAEGWPQQGGLEMKQYSMRYREGMPLVVKHITCSITGGQKIGIVGRTGAGKSSLTVALFRLVEKAEGSICIDGQDISQIGLHDLRNSLTIIPQEPVLFSGTLRLNLDPFGIYTDQQLWLALEQAHLKTFTTGLTQGLEHEIAEGGENLSVGQRQLVCLARALLRKTKVLVLDEATAAVDLETDELIQATIREEFGDCTVLTIAHRINTIMDYDKIMVMDAGNIKEFDSPEALLSDSNSLFHGLAQDAGIV